MLLYRQEMKYFINKNLQKKIMDILHNPEISDDEIEKQIHALMDEFGIDEEEFIRRYGEPSDFDLDEYEKEKPYRHNIITIR